MRDYFDTDTMQIRCRYAEIRSRIRSSDTLNFDRVYANFNRVTFKFTFEDGSHLRWSSAWGPRYLETLLSVGSAAPYVPGSWLDFAVTCGTVRKHVSWIIKRFIAYWSQIIDWTLTTVLRKRKGPISWISDTSATMKTTDSRGSSGLPVPLSLAG